MHNMRMTLAALALFCAACGSAPTPTVEGVPDDYPKDVPIYPGAKVTMAQSGPRQHLRDLMLVSNDSAGKIVDYYRKGLESNGWKIQNTMTSDQVSALTAVKDNRQAILQVLYREGKSTINQVVSDKP